MSAVADVSIQPPTAPVLPDNLATLDTGHGVIRFFATEMRVHGVQVNIKTEVSGSGAGWSANGTYHSSTTIGSKSQTIREFWLSPLDGGRDIRMELVDGEFLCADGHSILALYSHLEGTNPYMFAMVNINHGSATHRNDETMKEVNKQYCDRLLGQRSKLIGYVTLAVLGFSAWIGYKTHWAVGIGALIAGFIAQELVIKRIPALSRREAVLDERKRVEKQIREHTYLCLKWADKVLAPRWS